jgi:RNA polymerase sigma-70 factor (ECF subfamily)
METDIELLNAARMMNKEALVKIFDLNSAPLYRYAWHLCGDPAMADQIVGDVFAKLLDQFSAGHGPQSNLRPYLYKMTRHRIIDEARYSKRRVSLEAADWLGQAADTESLGLEALILFKQILHSIHNDLTNDQRHVIILRFLEGFSLRETAEIIGKEVSHVKVIQSRAITKLRQAMEYKNIRIALPSPEVGDGSRPLGI